MEKMLSSLECVREKLLVLQKPVCWGAHFPMFVQKKNNNKMFELMRVQIPAVWKERISISKWPELFHNGRNPIVFLLLVFGGACKA